MELIEGKPLCDLESDYMRMKPKKRHFILKQIYSALKKLKDLDIVHRDIKPDNILLNKKDNTIKILDFGLATAASKTVRRSGTPGFIAPEILNSSKKVVDTFCTKTDIFAIGAIHYCLVVGEHPFDAEDLDGVLENNRNCNLDLKKFELENLPLWEFNLLAGALEENQERRISLQKA